MADAVSLEFAKMHGLGNDFMVVDLVTQQGEITADLARAWGDRHTGVGYDQLLVIAPPTDPQADFQLRIYNTDGSEAQQCGNGIRCVAWYVAHRRLSPKPELLWQTAGFPTLTRRVDAQLVEVDMGEPRLEPAAIPLSLDHATPIDGLPATCEVDVEGVTCRLTTVSMGNPHAVLFVDGVSSAPVETLGPALVGHRAFPQGANIGFCEVVDPSFMRLRVFERGVGETRACGSGACAAVVAARLLEKVAGRVKVSLPGGKLRINWQGPGATVRMTGPTALVYEGRIEPQTPA